MAWRHIENPAVPWGATLSRILSKHRLPALDGPEIRIASDYSGTHPKALYKAISLIYCDLHASQEWFEIQRGFRTQFLPDGRRMSFKDLSDYRRDFSLIPFLKGADSISGVLCSLVVDRRVSQIAGGRSALKNPTYDKVQHGDWKPELMEEMSRLVHLVGLMMGGLAKPGQRFGWLSDEDAVFATPERSKFVADVLGALLDKYIPFELGQLNMWTTREAQDTQFDEDLAAIPDLAAGTLVSGLSSAREHVGNSLPLLVHTPLDSVITGKTDRIWDWLWTEDGQLAKICLFVQPTDDGGFSVCRFRGIA
jgi:hypothetical protein